MAAMKEQLDVLKATIAWRPLKGGVKERRGGGIGEGFTITIRPTSHGEAREHAATGGMARDHAATGSSKTVDGPKGLDQGPRLGGGSAGREDPGLLSDGTSWG